MGLILLIDMDSFFAACEELRHPDLKGKPFVVGTSEESKKEKAVIQTASYAARKFGVHSAMPFSTAIKLKPDLVYLPSDEKFYEDTSAKIVRLLESYRLKMEVMSIDEIAIDSGTDDYASALMAAKGMKSTISSEIGLPCTIGISVSKIYAKMVCDAFKPNKIGMVKKEELRKFLADKDVIKIIGVGEKTNERLSKMGIRKISELANANPVRLVEILGKFGAELSRIARGEDDSRIEEAGLAVSIGRETTLETETADISEISKVMGKLAKEATSELAKKNMWYRSVSGKVRYSDFTVRTKTRRLGNYTDSYEVALSTSIDLIKDLLANGKARKVGIRLTELVEKTGQARL